jgi:hypothetical protein
MTTKNEQLRLQLVIAQESMAWVRGTASEAAVLFGLPREIVTQIRVAEIALLQAAKSQRVAVEAMMEWLLLKSNQEVQA